VTTPIKLDTAAIRGWITEAAAIARRYFGNSTPEWKGVADPVTAADREIEQLLTTRIRATYPDHGIIGEEYGSAALDREYLWTVDPIDGTRVYVEGLPTWSITIALFHALRPVFGLVYLPLVDDWTYTEGDEVICNGRVVTGALKTRWQADSYIFWRSDAGTLWDLRFGRIMTFGSTATHVAYTARGAAVATIIHDSYLWDFAAGAAFMAKQGGVIRFLDGSPLDLTRIDPRESVRGTYIAGHPAVVDRLIPLLQPRAEPYHNPEW
jgi:myo-inositol-1(or 4)-monophosphatase